MKFMQEQYEKARRFLRQLLNREMLYRESPKSSHACTGCRVGDSTQEVPVSVS